MRKWKIESKLLTKEYSLIHNTKSGVSLVWFQKVEINNFSITLYDRNILTTYYSKGVLPKYIINELEKLPKMEK